MPKYPKQNDDGNSCLLLLSEGHITGGVFVVMFGFESDDIAAGGEGGWIFEEVGGDDVVGGLQEDHGFFEDAYVGEWT